MLLGALLATLMAVTAAATATPGAAEAVPGGDRFWSGVPYRGEFPSPQVLVDQGRYYAYATNTDGNNLPVMSSDDLTTWIPRDPLPDYQLYSSWAGYHDALPRPAAWAATRWDGKIRRYGIWAPAVARMGGRYVVAYTAMVDFSDTRLCISLGYSDSPEGTFTDTSRKPIVCSSDPRGSIDPHLIRSGGANYLIWKNAGVPGSAPTRIWVRRLNDRATAFRSGSKPHLLLTTSQPWEGNVIEAPAMVRYAGRLYLFYSGHSYTTDNYATGYAICKRVVGPCTRAAKRPLLATNDAVVGPGGASPFVDLNGGLRLAYHAWTAGHVGYTTDPSTCLGTEEGCNQRRLHIARLGVRSDGTLRVASLG